jgi:CheY-like chemotaxis protein
MDFQRQSETAHSPLLLFVDPDPDMHDLYRRFLAPRRYIVEHALEGRSALVKALSTSPDVIVTEVGVPGIDGISLCELLRTDRQTQSVPIIVLTGDQRPTVHEAARRAGATVVLMKPCLPDSLWRELQARGRHAGDRLVTPPVEQRIARTATRDHQRYVTSAPPAPPPPLHCPACDAMLVYDRSHVGGVSVKFAEQWDYYCCPTGCGDFQYRHRTRKVSRSAA